MLDIRWSPDDGAYCLTSQFRLPVARPKLFEFFSDAFQLEQITPPWLNFRVLTPGPITIKPGTLIDYQLKLRRIPIRWRTEISTWDPPYSFTDRQLKGPYHLWNHHHTFEAKDNETVIHDRVLYRVPGGAIIHRLFVKSELRKIFSFRQSRLMELFGNSESCLHEQSEPQLSEIRT